MNQHSEDLASEWRELAPAWIKEAREGRNPTRNGLLDEPILDALGSVKGLRVLDSGCGEGRFCRILVEHGAFYALGLDLCDPMIEAARVLQSERDEYRVANVENLHFIEDASFDRAVSYLNQCDLADFEANTREVFRVLKPGGKFVIANLHPMCSAIGRWEKDDEGNKLYFVVDRYFEEGVRRWRLMGSMVTNFHRTLMTYLDGFMRAGFTIERIVEPQISEEGLKQYPELDDERRRPNFIVYTLRKPESDAAA